ncbi:ketoreductase [Mucilaginibacter hurinus]|uniref:Ketoreductase n=1 Tax=Mucilaginibacter hurinus TaxID=2201324 RepID=A0A367GU24_9SPHI|nr:SDR family NAD(P)-dependent oxidoreductase [Mucilaginibacter hurinus]RCH56914.1 ketoreductase [Mucilaginibacter hurinus]
MDHKKIILITGATGGMGKATAIALANMGHTIIIHGRDDLKTEAIVKEIRSASGNDHIDHLTGDLYLMSDVKKIADAFKAKYDHLDVLINNAGGVMDKERSLTTEGFEKTMALNVLAPFLLTRLLIDHLKKSDHGRIVSVSSDAHSLSAKPDLNDIEMKKKYDAMTAYGNAKLYLIWNSELLAAELIKCRSKITTNTLHPGAVATSFASGSDLGWFYNFLAKLARPFMKTAEQGAATAIYLASSPIVSELTGMYFVNKKIAKPSTKYYTANNAKHVWEYCYGATKNWVDTE